jgi:hypothetical protein
MQETRTSRNGAKLLRNTPEAAARRESVVRVFLESQWSGRRSSLSSHSGSRFPHLCIL